MNKIHSIGAVNAKMTGDESEVKMKHIITQEDLDAHPELVEAGVKVGDEGEEIDAPVAPAKVAKKAKK